MSEDAARLNALAADLVEAVLVARAMARRADGGDAVDAGVERQHAMAEAQGLLDVLHLVRACRTLAELRDAAMRFLLATPEDSEEVRLATRRLALRRLLEAA